MREVGSDDFVGRAKYLNADGPRPTCCGRVWIFIKGVWMFLALVMAVAAMIWLGVYIQRHHKQVPGLRDTDREIEGSLMKFAIHSGELDGNFITKSFAVTCGEKKPCPKEVSIDVAFLPNSMVVLKFPPETYTCTPCSNPILNMVDPLPMAWWPLWDQRFAVTIHDSDITTTHRYASYVFSDCTILILAAGY